jgi:hypothetical protein
VHSHAAAPVTLVLKASGFYTDIFMASKIVVFLM